jgi:hypothetical protein
LREISTSLTADAISVTGDVRFFAAIQEVQEVLIDLAIEKPGADAKPRPFFGGLDLRLSSEKPFFTAVGAVDLVRGGVGKTGKERSPVTHAHHFPEVVAVDEISLRIDRLGRR